MTQDPTHHLEQISRGLLKFKAGGIHQLVRDIAAPDLGIDGEIEFCHEGHATGARLGFQIKAGESYLSSENRAEFRITIETRHLRYWCCVNIPVLLIYYHPETEELVWIEVKEWALRNVSDPTSQESMTIPIPRTNTISDSAPDRWRRILSRALEVDRQLREKMIAYIPEMALFAPPGRLTTQFAFTADRTVITDNFTSTDQTLIEVPQGLVPPLEIATTLLTFFSCGRRSSGFIQTQLGWPEVPFDTIMNDTVPIELPLFYRTFYLRLEQGSDPVKIVAKGYGVFL